MASISDGFTKAIDNYINALKDQINDVLEAGTNLVKFEAISYSDFEGLLDPGSVSEALEDASAVMDALGDNPLVAKMMEGLEDQFGISIRGPLQLAQTLVNGGNSGLLQVALAMLRFPSKSATYITLVNASLETIKTLNDQLDAPGMSDALSSLTAPFSETQIPSSVTSLLGAARISISQSLRYPFQEHLYLDGLQKIKTAAQELESLPILGSTVKATSGAMLTSVFDTIYTNLKESFTASSTLGNELAVMVDTIRNTDITKKPTDSRFSQARKALLDLSALVYQMKDSSVQQRIQIPQYLVSLTLVYNFLEASKPATDIPPVLDQASVTIDSSKISTVEGLLRKLLVFLKKPYKAGALPSFVDELKTAVDEVTVALAETEAQIEALWLSIPETKTLIESIMDLLDGYGYAQEALSTGDLEGFAALGDISATDVGAAFNMCIVISELAQTYNMFGLSEEMKKMRNKLEEDSDEKYLEQETKKDKRATKLKQKLSDINKRLNDLNTLIAYFEAAVGTLQDAWT